MTTSIDISMCLVKHEYEHRILCKPINSDYEQWIFCGQGKWWLLTQNI